MTASRRNLGRHGGSGPVRLRGNALVEFALGFGLLLPIFAGLWQFGYSFYLYNQLQTVVRNGARYGSFADYDNPNGNTFRDQVKRMAVYGDPFAPDTATSVVTGLTLDHITVSADMDGVVPTRVHVRVQGYVLNGLFATYTLDGKPSCKFEYVGQLLNP